MKRIGIILSTALLLNLCACSFSSNDATSSVPKQTESKTVSAQQLNNTKPIFFNQKEVRQIKLVSTKTKDTKLLKKEKDIKNIISTIEEIGLMKKPDGSLQTLVLDKEATDAINYNMAIYFKDGSIGNYLVWFEDEDRVTVGHKGTPAKSHLEFYRIKNRQKGIQFKSLLTGNSA